MKKFVWLAVCLSALLVVSCISFADSKVVLKLGHSVAANDQSDCHVAATFFANYVNQKSSDLEIRIYPNSQLGGDQEQVQGLQMGTLDFHVGGTAIMGDFVKSFGVLDLPFLWKNYNQYHKAIDGTVGTQLNAAAEKAGIKQLSYFDSWGYRHVLTKKEINKPEDLKGLKIRCIETPTNMAAIKIMGANPTPMAMGEVYTAFQSGVIDGMEHCPATIVANKFYEVAKNYTLTGHLFGPLMLDMSMKSWNKLSAKDKNIILAAAKYAATKERSLAAAKEKEGMDTLKKLGVRIVKIDTSSFAKAAVSYQNDYAKQIGVTDLLTGIRNTK